MGSELADGDGQDKQGQCRERRYGRARVCKALGLRLSSHSSWQLPLLTFLCADISSAMVRGGPLSAEDCPDMMLASSSNRRLSLGGASRMIISATRGSMLEKRETLVLPAEYESRRRGFPDLCFEEARSPFRQCCSWLVRPPAANPPTKGGGGK